LIAEFQLEDAQNESEELRLHRRAEEEARERFMAEIQLEEMQYLRTLERPHTPHDDEVTNCYIGMF